MLVSTEWLAKNLSDPSVIVIVVDRNDSAYKAGHVPGARYLPYVTLGQTVDGIQLELPSPDSIRNLFESAGVSSSSHVILTGRPLTVTRAFYTLDYIGMQHVSALDGGFTKWKRENRAVETTAPLFARGTITPSRCDPGSSPKPPGCSIALARKDSRSSTRAPTANISGSSSRGGLRSLGHLDGARRLEWQDAFTDSNDFSPKSLAELGRMWNERVAPGDTVIAYCYIGYRASGSYFISRLLGYPAKLYDGSYDEWARLKYPTVTAVTPLRKP